MYSTVRRWYPRPLSETDNAHNTKAAWMTRKLPALIPCPATLSSNASNYAATAVRARQTQLRSPRGVPFVSAMLVILPTRPPMVAVLSYRSFGRIHPSSSEFMMRTYSPRRSSLYR